MPTIAALTSFSGGTTIQSSQVNANFTEIRNTVNTYGMFTDVARTVTAVQTFSATPICSAGLTVSGSGVTVTGNSTITGTLGGVTTLTCTTVTATNLGGTLSTAAQPNVTSVGTLATATITTLTATTITGLANLSLTGNVQANGQIYTNGLHNAGPTQGGLTIDWDNGGAQYMQWNSNGTTIVFANTKDGAVYHLLVDATNCNSGSVTWPATVRWPGGTPPPSVPSGTVFYGVRFVADTPNNTIWGRFDTY
jgi:hypothetical protein